MLWQFEILNLLLMQCTREGLVTNWLLVFWTASYIYVYIFDSFILNWGCIWIFVMFSNFWDSEIWYVKIWVKCIDLKLVGYFVFCSLVKYLRRSIAIFFTWVCYFCSTGAKYHSPPEGFYFSLWRKKAAWDVHGNIVSFNFISCQTLSNFELY